MQLFDGRTQAREIEDIIIKAVPSSKNSDKIFAIIQIGNTDSTDKYAALKKKFCDAVGVKAQIYKISEFSPDDIVLSEVEGIVNDAKVGGVIIQLPLPRSSLKSVLECIPLDKDIDILSSKSIEQYNSGILTQMPPVVRAFDYFIKHFDIDLQSKDSTVIGFGTLVGKPISVYLSKYGSKVTVLDNYITGQKLSSDVVVLCAGVARLVNGEDLKEGSAVVDFGYNMLEGKPTGDLNYSSNLEHLGYLSPSPGGMGPLDVRFLVMNFLGI